MSGTHQSGNNKHREPPYLSTDPYAGEPIDPSAKRRVLSTDPNAGEPDPLYTLLHRAPLNDRQRAGLWDVYQTAKNADDLAARLRRIDVPQELKAQMWDLKLADQQYLSRDPYAGEPIPHASAPRVLSTDPNAGEPLDVNTRAHTWSNRLGLNAPTDSMLTGFLRGAGGAAVDMAQGAMAKVANRLHQNASLQNTLEVQRTGDPRALKRPAPTTTVMDAPDTVAGKVGSLIPAVAEMAAPVGGVMKAGSQAIPRTARASEKFKEVMGAARDIPIETKAVGDVALRIQELAERGGAMPMAVRKLLNRMTDPNKAAMTYEEARDFASNISRLSADDYKRLTPVVRREVATLSAELNLANAQAARQAGKMTEYKSAMREYAQAMRLKELAQNAVKAAKKLAPWATAAGAAEWVTRDLRR